MQAFLLTYRSEGLANGQTLTLGLTAQFWLEKATGSRWHVRVSAPQVTLQQNGEPDPQRASTVAQMLASEPFALEVDSAGRVTQLLVPASYSELASTYLRLALSPLVLHTPQIGTGKRREIEAGGHYEVAYVAHGKQQWERRYVRRIRGEQSTVALPGIHGTATQTRVDGATQLTFLPSGALQALSHKRTQQTQLGDQTASVSTEVLTLRPLSLTNKTSAIQLGKLTRLPLLVELAPGKFEVLIRTNTLGKETEASLFARLDSPLLDNKAQTDYLLKLQAFFYLHPERTLPTVNALAGKADSSLRFLRIIGALAAIGTAPAQRALLQLLKRRQSEESTSLRILGVLANLAAPLPETVHAMESLSDHGVGEVAPGALLALGALASALNGNAQSTLVQRLEARLAKANTEKEKRLVLLALGNAGAVRSLPVITRFIPSESPALRAAAARALRHMPAATKVTLLQKLKSDPDAMVRQEAEQALF